jgi:hypothetical protein
MLKSTLSPGGTPLVALRPFREWLRLVDSSSVIRIKVSFDFSSSTLLKDTISA